MNFDYAHNHNTRTARIMTIVVATALHVLGTGDPVFAEPMSSCAAGSYRVSSLPLVEEASPKDGLIVIEGGQVSIGSNCPPVAARIRSGRRSTRVTATWDSCTGLTGRVRFTAVITPLCDFIPTATLRAAGFGKRFSAHAVQRDSRGSLAQIPKELGMYVWGGLLTNVPEENRLVASVKRVLDEGFQTVNLLLSPTAKWEYHLLAPGTPDPCRGRSDYLSCLLETPAYQSVLSDARVKILVLTTFDAASRGEDGYDLHFMNRPWLIQNEGRVFEEYRSLFRWLFSRYGARDLRIIVKNWESESQVYCSQAANYAADSDIEVDGRLVNARTFCEGFFGQQANMNTPVERFAGLQKWSEIRQAALDSVRSDNASRGEVHSLKIDNAIEAAMIDKLATAGLPDTLRSIVSTTFTDVVSYSSWESRNNRTLYTDSNRILTLMRETIPSRPRSLVIGELGFMDSEIDIASSQYWQALQLINERLVDAVVYWEGFPKAGWGFFDGEGDMMPNAEEILGNHGVQQITGAIYKGTIPAVVDGLALVHNWFELYGAFNRYDNIVVVCPNDPQLYAAEVVYRSDRQFNVSIPTNLPVGPCTFGIVDSFNRRVY